MKDIELKGYYLPTDFRYPISEFLTRVYRQGDISVRLKTPVVTPDMVNSLLVHLKENRDKFLVRMPVERIVGVLNEASVLWLDRDYVYRRQAIEIIPAITGFSSETIEASIDIEMESSLSDDMWRALHSEMGNPLYLDDFQYSDELGGYRRAFGPGLVVSFFSENIPALPHLLFMRASLVKAACLGKVASGEPAFAALYLKTIEEIDPEMAASMAVLYWQGGNQEVEDAAFSHADAVVAFGAVETCASLSKRIPRNIKTLVHGHRMGFGIIGKNKMTLAGVDELSRAVAYDHAMFDQKACLAPQVYFVETGGEVSPVEFARMVSGAMASYEEKMPRGRLSAGEAAVIHQQRGRYEIREFGGDDVRMFAPSCGTSWTVVYEKAPGLFSPSVLNRFVRIWAVEDIFQALEALRPVGQFLQNAAVAVGDEREAGLIRRLGELGVARITSPGSMPTPSMMWRHDGMATLASLLRWCDVEKKDDITGFKD